MTAEIPVRVGFKDNNIENVRWDNLGLLTDNAASSYKVSDLATIPLAIRVSAGGHRQKNGERCAAMQERIIFSAIMRQRKQLNWLMILLLVAFSGSFLILVEEEVV